MKPDIDKITDRLLIDLPDSYCEFIDAVSQLPNPQESFESAISLDTDHIIALNEYLSTLTDVAGLDELPEELFSIGEDGCGNYFFINCEEEDSPVLFYDHDDDEILQVAETLTNFAAGILKLTRDE